MMKRIGELKAENERLRMEQKLKAVPVEAYLIDRVADLKAEVERLTLHIELDEVDRRNGLCCDAKYRFQELEEQVDRLTKAGDDLETWVLILRHNNPTDIEDFRSVVLNWNAAKNGGQS
jgi:predicted nuclease with TOPRIM domain